MWMILYRIFFPFFRIYFYIYFIYMHLKVPLRLCICLYVYVWIFICVCTYIYVCTRLFMSFVKMYLAEIAPLSKKTFVYSSRLQPYFFMLCIIFICIIKYNFIHYSIFIFCKYTS